MKLKKIVIKLNVHKDEKLDHSYFAGKNEKLFRHFIKKFLSIRNLNMQTPYNPVIALQSIYPWEIKAHIHTVTSRQISKAFLFIIPKYWKQPRWSSVDEWLNSLRYVEYYSEITKEWPVDTQDNLGESPELHSEKCNLRSYILNDLIYITFLKWQNYANKID